MKKILKKYKPNDYEFNLPKKLIKLTHKKDYNQYINKQHNNLMINFITNNNITNNNSNSPIINNNNNLINLTFNNNYKTLNHKIQFNPIYNHTICINVHYIL